MTFKQYRKKGKVDAVQMAADFSVLNPDQGRLVGKQGDWVVRDPDNHMDQWVVQAKYFATHYEEC